MESDPYVQWVILSNLNITYYPLSFTTILSGVTTLFLLFCSALISGSEVAFFSLSPTDIKQFNDSPSRSSKNASQLVEHPNNLLATILVSNNFINIAIVILSGYTINALINFAQVPILGFIIQIVVITFLLLLFGEIIPKVYANQYPFKFANFMATPLSIISTVFQPLSSLLVSSTRFVERRTQKRQNLSMDELSDALEITSESIADDKEILKGIIEFASIEASEIMCPRVDVTAVEINSGFSTIMENIMESGYSRIPVYDESFDNVKGILYIKDLLPHLGKEDSFHWQSLIRKPYFIPEKKKINELLEELQHKKIHMAVVVDEYGGTAGIITMEDILEEIVGEISDEFDDEEVSYAKMDDNNYLFDGKTLLNDFYKIVDVDNNIFDEVKGDADTLAGLILEIKGDFPRLYDKIKYKNYTFTIEAVDKRRIVKIKTSIVRTDLNPPHNK